jgi:putative transposase
MIRGFKYPLRPTGRQAAELTRWLGVCCDLYNGALQERRDAWRIARKQVSCYDQQRQLAPIRAADADLSSVPFEVQKSPLVRVDQAFKAFFRRGRGFPRFRPRRRYASFSIAISRAAAGIGPGFLRLPHLGRVRLHQYRPPDGQPKHASVRLSPTGAWSVVIFCESETPAKIPVRAAVGIDLGLKAFAALSDGTEVAVPQFFRRAQATLKRRQQALARRQRGSRSRERARVLVAKAHEHIANQRREFARKLACTLFERYDLVAHEDLEVRGMVRGHFAKSVNDAGWKVFLHALHCKAESAGKHAIAVDPGGTTQRCSGCGQTVPKGIGDRVHSCPGCGLVLGRDHNAALNVLALGRSAVEGSKSGPVESEAAQAALSRQKKGDNHG